MTTRWLPRTALALAAVMLATACGQGGGASPTPAPTDNPPPTSAVTASPGATPAPATAEPTTAATTAPTAAATPGEIGLAVDSLAEVIATDPMVIRSEPRIADDSVIYENQLTTGDRLFVTMGPLFESGYEWYQVQPIQRPGASAAEELPFGFVAAASREGDPWLRALDFDCPSAPTLENLIGLSPEERLVCYSGGEFTFEGDSQGCGIQDPQTIEPGWFQNPICNFGSSTAFLSVRLPPEGPGGPVNGRVQVTGHFDDPRAQDCVWINDNPDIPEPPVDQVILRCRMEFVATAIAPAP